MLFDIEIEFQIVVSKQKFEELRRFPHFLFSEGIARSETFSFGSGFFNEIETAQRIRTID
jgi:hypothetical protein